MVVVHADIGAEGIPRTKSAGTLGDHGGSAGDLCCRFLAKTIVLFGCVTILSEFANSIPRLVLEYTYGGHIYWSSCARYDRHLHGIAIAWQPH